MNALATSEPEFQVTVCQQFNVEPPSLLFFEVVHSVCISEFRPAARERVMFYFLGVWPPGRERGTAKTRRTNV